ncbi:IS3 family transposase [Faecalicoccus pleomorphus]
MEKIQQIHKESHGIYGAPKITECLKKEVIPYHSERSAYI